MEDDVGEGAPKGGRGEGLAFWEFLGGGVGFQEREERKGTWELRVEVGGEQVVRNHLGW